MPHKITSPNGNHTNVSHRVHTGAPALASSPLSNAPWMDGVLFLRDDDAAALSYYLRSDRGFLVEEVAVVDPEWAASVARIRARGAAALGVAVTSDEVAAVVAEIEGA